MINCKIYLTNGNRLYYNTIYCIFDAISVKATLPKIDSLFFFSNCYSTAKADEEIKENNFLFSICSLLSFQLNIKKNNEIAQLPILTCHFLCISGTVCYYYRLM